MAIRKTPFPDFKPTSNLYSSRLETINIIKSDNLFNNSNNMKR